MTKYTVKNANRKNHEGGNPQHIQARRDRRLLGGAFGHVTDNHPSLAKASNLTLGTSAQKDGVVK